MNPELYDVVGRQGGLVLIPTRFLLSFGVAAFILSGRGRLEAQDHRARLLAAERATAELSRDSGLAIAMSHAVQPDGILLWPGAPVVIGDSAVRRLLGTLPDRDSFGLTWQPLAVELARDSSLGISWGVAVATGRVISSAPRIGRYMSVRRRQGDRWPVAAVLFLGFPAPAAALPRGLRLTQTAAAPSGSAGRFIQADLAFARLAGDSGAAVAFYRWAAPEAVIFGGGGLLTRGPDAIGQAVAGPARWRWHPVAAGASQSGDVGWTVGEAVITPEGAEADYSKYLTVWSRRPDGSLRFIADGGNARPSAP
jgi:hypothetical protein